MDRREAYSSADKMKSVNFAPSTHIPYTDSEKPPQSHPHYYRSGPSASAGYFASSMNYSNQPGQISSYPMSSTHLNSYFGTMYPYPGYTHLPYPSASSSSTPGRNNLHVNPSDHEIRAAVEASSNVLRSPPSKKRRVKESPLKETAAMGSWDDDDDHIGVMSPSVFRSPKDDGKVTDQMLTVS